MKVRGKTPEIISTLTPALSRQREREVDDIFLAMPGCGGIRGWRTLYVILF